MTGHETYQDQRREIVPKISNHDTPLSAPGALAHCLGRGFVDPCGEMSIETSSRWRSVAECGIYGQGDEIELIVYRHLSVSLLSNLLRSSCLLDNFINPPPFSGFSRPHPQCSAMNLGILAHDHPINRSEICIYNTDRQPFLLFS